MSPQREAIVLAGGFGMRLRPLVGDRPKPLAEINGRPFLTYLFDYLLGYGYTRVILSVGYKHEMIRNCFAERYRELVLSYAVEDTPLGTGGGIRAALALTTGDQVTVLNGDSYFPVDLDAMARVQAEESDMTMALRRLDNCERYGTVRWSGARVLAFMPRGAAAAGYINGGIYMLRTSIVDALPRQKRFSFESDFLLTAIPSLTVRPYVSSAYFIDIGIPEDYQRASAEFALKEE